MLVSCNRKIKMDSIMTAVSVIRVRYHLRIMARYDTEYFCCKRWCNVIFRSFGLH